MQSQSSRKRRRLLTVGSAAALMVAGAAPHALASNHPSQRAVLAGSTPGWVATHHPVGTPPAATKIGFRVVMPLRNAAGAARFAARVSNPKSHAYGHYLTPRRFNARYAPTRATVAGVRSYLMSHGFHISSVAQGNRWVDATGTVAQAEAAFHTTVKNYRLHGQTLREATSPLSIPAAMAHAISGIIGVSELPARRPALAHRISAQSRGQRPADAVVPPRQSCSTYWDQFEQVSPAAYGRTSFPTNNCGYTGAQLRGAYGVQNAVNRGTTGTGVTVAIIDAYASATIVDDANALAASQGEPTFAPGQYTETDFGPFDLQDECGPDGWNEEETLDVEAVHGLAPGANIHYIGAQDCVGGIDAAVNYVLQNHVANLVSNSYGFLGEDGLGDEVGLEHSQFVQAAAEGIGFYYSTGDNGDNTIAGTPHPEPDYPASDPLVTGVGGTSLAINANNGYQFETSWGDDLDSVNFATTPSSLSGPLPGSFVFGGGGGVSALFAEPLYQKLAVPPSLAKLNGTTPMRVVPDVADVGDPETGYAIDFRGTPITIGGTSLACPVFAGIQALASQGRRTPIGFANPLLYVLGLTRVVFHDVQAPSSPVALMTQSGRSLLTLGQDSSLTSTRGYDDTTGLGTPNGPALLLGEKLLP
jgi:subtilase family serine protease